MACWVHTVCALDWAHYFVQTRLSLSLSLPLVPNSISQIRRSRPIWCMKRVLSFSENWSKFQNAFIDWTFGKGCWSTGDAPLAVAVADHLATIRSTHCIKLVRFVFFLFQKIVIAQPFAMRLKRLILAQLLDRTFESGPESYLPLITHSLFGRVPTKFECRGINWVR